MRQLYSGQRSHALLRSIGFAQIISLTGLLILTSCAPRADSTRTESPIDTSRTAQSSPNPASTAPGTAADSPADMTLDPDSANILDNALVIKGAQDNIFEIQAGQLAARQAASPEVKQFAQKMVQDHTQAAPLLQQVATERNITLPTEMGDQNQAILARLSNLSGAEFDRAYMTEMVNSHQQDVALVRNQTKNGKDQALKSLASEKLPALEAHLQLAQRLAQRLSS